MPAVQVGDAPLRRLIMERVRALQCFLSLPDLESKFQHLQSQDATVAAVGQFDLPLRQYMDHTVLKPTAVAEDIIALCEEAKEMKFKAVCVHACHVAFCKERLAGTEVSVACVCDFPHGQSTPAMKRRQAEDILSLGADEIDVVLNVGLLKDQNYPGVFSDVGEIATAVSAAGKCLKVILETCLLTPQEIIDACIICVACGVGFVKTSTGFSTGGATREAVVIMLTVVGPNCLVKASGGIRDRHTTQEYLRLGVKRIGTSSGVTICK